MTEQEVMQQDRDFVYARLGPRMGEGWENSWNHPVTCIVNQQENFGKQEMQEVSEEPWEIDEEEDPIKALLLKHTGMNWLIGPDPSRYSLDRSCEELWRLRELEIECAVADSLKLRADEVELYNFVSCFLSTLFIDRIDISAYCHRKYPRRKRHLC